MVFQLIYTCALSTGYCSAELSKLAETSSAKNKAKDLTGILLCDEGSVLQVLEGEQDSVEELYENIIADKRVTNPLVLIKRTIDQREFPEWSMGYRNAVETNSAFDLTAESVSERLPPDISPEVDTIGRTFVRVNGLS